MYNISFASEVEDSLFAIQFGENYSRALEFVHLDSLLYMSLDYFDSDGAGDFKNIEMIRANYTDELGKIHLVYGDFKSKDRPYCVHFIENEPGKIERVNIAFDTLKYGALLDIVKTNSSLIQKARTERIDLNYYFAFQTDTIVYYALPSWQSSGFAVYGLEYSILYKVLKGGAIKEISRDSVKRDLAYFKESEDEIHLNYKDSDAPTVASIFFVYLYHDYFKKIVIDTKHKQSYLVNAEECQFMHVHKK
jgi:hypothetical protein